VLARRLVLGREAQAGRGRGDDERGDGEESSPPGPGGSTPQVEERTW
jgi:hypothetical protein